MERGGLGSWIVITVRTGAEYQGELISVDSGYVRVLTAAGYGVFDTGSIKEARVYTYESEGGPG